MADGNSIIGLIPGSKLATPAWAPGPGALDAMALGSGLGDLAVLFWAPLILVTLCSAAVLLFLLRPARSAAQAAATNAHKEMKAVRAALRIAQIIEAAPSQVSVVATNPPPPIATRRPVRRALPRHPVSGREPAPWTARV